MEWKDDFIYKMEINEGLFQCRRYLLVLDRHKSHINLNVLLKAKDYRVDIISIPSYTSHEF